MNPKITASRFLFAIIAILGAIAQTSSADTFGQFTYTDNGTSITITGYSNGAGGPATIPGEIVGKPVTAIGSSAFHHNSGLTGITIPSSVTLIGGGAFTYCTSLASVSGGSGVTTIGTNSFSGCSALTSFAIPANVTSIGNGAFGACSGLTNVTFPDGVTFIGDSAFDGCNKLTSLTLPSGLTSIGSGAFNGCTGLTGMIIPSGVTSIGATTFAHCTGMMSVTIPFGVTSIGGSAFYHCAALLGVTIPSSVVSIGSSAFYNCSELTSITIPASVTSIGAEAFIICNKLASATFLGNAPSIGSNVFAGSAAGFTLYYVNGRTGFTSPTWNGYPTDTLNLPDIAVEQSGINLTGGVASVNCGSIDLGGTSGPITFTIKNTGSAELTGLAIVKDGTHDGEFTVSGLETVTLAPDTSTNFTVTFAPGAQGSRTAAIHLASNDPDETTFTIALTGTGTVVTAPEIAVKLANGTNLVNGTAKKNFGKVMVGDSGKTVTFTIRNTGTANLTGLGITVAGKKGSFVVTAPANSSLAPGAKTKFDVKFKPSTTGNLSATISIASNDADENPFKIKLTGKGIASGGVAPTVAKAAGSPALSTTDSTTVTLMEAIGGRNYLTLVVRKAPQTEHESRTVEVSSNLVDWYSGANHTTILEDNESLLKVRDNTPHIPGKKRYIRLKSGF